MHTNFVKERKNKDKNNLKSTINQHISLATYDYTTVPYCMEKLNINQF